MNIQQYHPRRFEKERKIVLKKLKKESEQFYNKYRPKVRKTRQY